jgi:HEAT repeat protein
MSRSFLFAVSLTALTTLAPMPGAAAIGDPGAEGFGARAFDGDGGARSSEYRDGQKALDDERWKDAANIFKKLAAERGGDADAALYWQAYALAKDGKEEDALATLRALHASYPKSDWIDDAEALEVEMRGDTVTVNAVASGSASETEELKLYALNGLMQAEPEKAVPVLRKFLQGNSSPRLKKQALFVLSQTESPEAQRLLLEVAKGRFAPGLQREAIQQLGVAGGKESVAALKDLYAGTNDPRVKEAVLNAYLVCDAEGEVVAIARGDQDPAMRRRAIQQLGAMDATAGLRDLYAKETSQEVRRTILEAMGVAGDVDALVQAARAENDPELRRRAIQSMGVAGGAKAGAALKQLYASFPDYETRRAVLEGLFVMDDAKALIELFRAEKDPKLKKAIVEKLSIMDDPAAQELLLKMLDN